MDRADERTSIRFLDAYILDQKQGRTMHHFEPTGAGSRQAHRRSLTRFTANRPDDGWPLGLPEPVWADARSVGTYEAYSGLRHASGGNRANSHGNLDSTRNTHGVRPCPKPSRSICSSVHAGDSRTITIASHYTGIDPQQHLAAFHRTGGSGRWRPLGQRSRRACLFLQSGWRFCLTSGAGLCIEN